MRSRLDRPGWRYAAGTSSEAMTEADWAIIEAQRGPFFEGRTAREALALLETGRAATTFGYQINYYRHSLQAATLAFRDGADEELVVVALLHDIGYTIANATHGEFAAAILGPYISEANDWLLRHHQHFQARHCLAHPTADRGEHERFRGHPAFAHTADFVARYDQNAEDPGYDCMPLEAFVPMVHRLFARPPRRC